MHTDSLRRRVVRGLAWESATKLGLQILGWVSTIYVARILGPAAYGVVAIAGIYTLLIQIAVDHGPITGLVTRAELDRDDLRASFWANLYCAAVLYAALWLAAAPLARAYGEPVLAAVIRANGLGVFAIALRAIPAAIVLRALDYRARALAEFGGQAVQTVAILVLATLGYGVWSLVYSFLLGQAVATCALLYRVRFVPGAPTAALGRIRDVLAYGMHVTGGRLAQFGLTIADMATVSWLVGARAAGHYLMAQNLANMPLDKLGSIVNRVAFPAIARLQADRERARAYFLTAHFWLVAVCAPLAVGGALVAPDLVALLFTDAWRDAGTILRLLCVAAAFRLSGMVMPPVLEGLRHASFLVRYALASACVLVPGFMVGAALAGAVGVAVAWAALAPLLWLALAHRTLALLGVRWSTFLRSVVPVVGALGVLVAAVLAAEANLPPHASPPLALAMRIGAGAIAYAVALLVFAPRARWRDLRTARGDLRRVAVSDATELRGG